MTQTTGKPPLGDDVTDQDKFLGHVSDIVSHGVSYLVSRRSLAVTEAKVAAIRVVLVRVLALCAVVILCGTWALLCFALAHWLVSAQAVTVPLALLAVVLANIVFLLVIALCARNLVSSLTLETSLNPSEPLNRQGKI